MRPANLKTKIFLDGGDPFETKEIIHLLGFLDGQTTNPTLIAKNPVAKERLTEGKKFSETEIYTFYKDIVSQMSALIPDGSISIEVYADQHTPVDRIYAQSKEMYEWIPNTHIKFPIIPSGIEAAHRVVAEGMRVNMTLCFSQNQAAAVHTVTRGTKVGQVFISPFVGRLDDIGKNGMDLIKNTLTMYREVQSAVEVITASVRSLDHFLYALALGTDIITAPAPILRQWAKKEMVVPEPSFHYEAPSLSPIQYEHIAPNNDWHAYDIFHPLTDKGITMFANDWNALID